jgi:hypothetical protein
VLMTQDLTTLIKIFAPASFNLVEANTPISTSQALSLIDKDFWKQLFSILKENADLSLNLAEQLTSETVD